MKHYLRLIVFLFCPIILQAQTSDLPPEPKKFTRQDTLRGSLRPERTCYDVTFYDLNLTVNPSTKAIAGHNIIRYRVKTPFSRMQVDLFENLAVESITQAGQALKFEREGAAIWITMDTPQTAGKIQEIKVTYSGKPREAIKAPWDGGFSWKKDSTGKDWVGVSCEGLGASSWWPCKDHLSDEPDSMRMTFRVPRGLTAVSNGVLRSRREVGAAQTEFVWAVSYPINSYNVTFNLGDYVHFSDTYRSRDHKYLKLNYYVLKYNTKKAKPHFEQVKGMLDCYEWHFGHYPFWRDGFALVETPYWGMEHQSAIAYGNNYQNNPFGFDFIIIHESGHEYFGNSVSCADHAEMWIHEAFTTYMESIYVECTQGYEQSQKYIATQKKLVKNQFPMLGPLGVNYEAQDNDIYYKGAWLLNTLRHVVDDDDLWFRALRQVYTDMKHSVVSTPRVIELMSRELKRDVKPIFNQYLNYAKLPVFEYKVTDKGETLEIQHRWDAEGEGFTMPTKVGFGFNPKHTIYPTREWQTTVLKKQNGWFHVASNLYLIGIRPLSL
ncbi:M1 family metallopeptidase [Tellurirhabdus bombi]|uniref:M1 family metallopeptidase n=1 Tax=Tellurirhabdus bombi TaxID=2907205 RepID=UPI001F28C696|nr:M1 family metallopeptidase [Tellurirhabdus bombi]